MWTLLASALNERALVACIWAQLTLALPNWPRWRSSGRLATHGHNSTVVMNCHEWSSGTHVHVADGAKPVSGRLQRLAAQFRERQAGTNHTTPSNPTLPYPTFHHVTTPTHSPTSRRSQCSAASDKSCISVWPSSSVSVLPAPHPFRRPNPTPILARRANQTHTPASLPSLYPPEDASITNTHTHNV